MNSNTVLGKIMTLLSMNRGEVYFTIAKLSDGTLVESETFDVGEPVEVINEDGTKTPAPDGEHLLELEDESGNINRIKIFTEGGIITERENVEVEAEEHEDKEEKMADVETEDVKKLPESGEVKPLEEQVTLESEEMVDEEVVDKEAEEITLKDAISKIEEMRERIEELATKLQEIEISVGTEEEEEELQEEEEVKEEEMESKRLDGAPVEKSMFNKQKKTDTFKIPNSHNSVLSRMYRK
jgi:hypothetical protein